MHSYCSASPTGFKIVAMRGADIIRRRQKNGPTIYLPAAATVTASWRRCTRSRQTQSAPQVRLPAPDATRTRTSVPARPVNVVRLHQARHKLMARCEPYGPDNLSPSIKVITAGADVRPDRIEVQIVAWADADEVFVVTYIVLHGDPRQPQIWQELDAVGAMEFRVRGREGVMKITALAIDAGGSNTQDVFAIRKRAARLRVRLSRR